MKRIYIAFILLIFIAVICISEYRFITKSSEQYIYEISKIEDVYAKEKKNEALILTKKLSENWSKSSLSMDTFLYHDYVDDISRNISKLKIFIDENDEGSFNSTCEELKTQLESLKKNEFPTLYNII